MSRVQRAVAIGVDTVAVSVDAVAQFSLAQHAVCCRLLRHHRADLAGVMNNGVQGSAGGGDQPCRKESIE